MKIMYVSIVTLAQTLLISAVSAAPITAQNYKCFSYFWNYDDNSSGTLDLSIKGNEAVAKLKGEDWLDNVGGTLSTTYKPRGNSPYVKFGSNLIVEKILLTGGRPLQDGKRGGFARVEGEAEGGFYQYRFICKKK